MLYLYSFKQCIIRQTEYEGIENTSYDATCCIRIIHTHNQYVQLPMHLNDTKYIVTSQL